MPRNLQRAWYKKIVDRLAIKYKKDPRVIEYIAYYPFSFLKQIVNDENNNRPIRLRHLGIFFLRHNDLKNIVYVKRMAGLKKYMSILVKNDIFKSEKEGLIKIEAMTKGEVTRFYKKYILLMKQI